MARKGDKKLEIFFCCSEWRRRRWKTKKKKKKCTKQDTYTKVTAKEKETFEKHIFLSMYYNYYRHIPHTYVLYCTRMCVCLLCSKAGEDTLSFAFQYSGGGGKSTACCMQKPETGENMTDKKSKKWFTTNFRGEAKIIIIILLQCACKYAYSNIFWPGRQTQKIALMQASMRQKSVLRENRRWHVSPGIWQLTVFFPLLCCFFCIRRAAERSKWRHKWATFERTSKANRVLLWK